jgi:ribose transport system permease protein
VLGALVAVFFIAFAVSGLILAGAQPWVEDVFNGAALLIAVGLTAYIRRRAVRRAASRIRVRTRTALRGSEG